MHNFYKIKWIFQKTGQKELIKKEYRLRYGGASNKIMVEEFTVSCKSYYEEQEGEN